MTPDNSCSTITVIPPLPYCRHRTPSGRRCRLAIADPDSGLCARHAAQFHRDLDQPDLADSLIGDIQEFRSAADINHSLGELYKLQACDKISPRRAAVMAYTANLLLRTLPAIARDNGLQAQKEPLVFDYSDWPGPDEKWPEGTRLLCSRRPSWPSPRPQAQTARAGDPDPGNKCPPGPS
jgi:hypothetical protein